MLSDKAVIKVVKAILNERADSVRVQAGVIIAKRGFYYRHGMDSKKFAARVKSILLAQGWDAEVVGEEKWASWPKDSFWKASVVSVGQVPVYGPEQV